MHVDKLVHGARQDVLARNVVFPDDFGCQALERRVLGHVDHLVDRLAPEQSLEVHVAGVDGVEVSTALQEGMDDAGFVGLARGRDVQRGVLVGGRVLDVGIRTALQQQPDHLDRRELADRIPTHGGTVPRAGQVERRAAVAAARAHSEKLVHGPFDGKRLALVQVRKELGEQAHEVQDDDQGAVEVRHVPLHGRRVAQGLLADADFRHGFLKNGHNITEVHWRMVRRRRRRMVGRVGHHLLGPRSGRHGASAAIIVTVVLLLPLRGSLVDVPRPALAHHVREQLGETQEGALCHQTQRLQHFLLHFQRVHPQGDASLKMTHVRVNGTPITNVIRCVRMSWSQNPLSDEKSLHAHLVGVGYDVL